MTKIDNIHDISIDNNQAIRGTFMEITHLRYFKKTAELEHITKAAQELHVAQPSLSRTISMLEDELKVKLFNRKGKSIELNEYGMGRQGFRHIRGGFRRDSDSRFG